MKNRIISGVYYLLTAALLGFGPLHLFPVCPVTAEKTMKCWWAAQAEVAVAVILAVVGLAVLLCRSASGRRMASLCAAAAGLSAILIPARLIGYCMKPEMSCRMLTFPIVYALGAALILFSAANFLYLKKQK